jgi:hypothetical protein
MRKKILRKLDWWFDYYIAWMFYNGNKTHKYIEYMEKKWNKNANTERIGEK